MTDREIFRENLNYYLNLHKVMQKDLAEAIGAKYTTVSGWTRGISYPRADAMEKIANYFGIPTSELISERKESFNDLEQAGKNRKSEKVRTLMQNVSQLDEEDIDQLNDMFYVMFSRKFKKGTDNK